MAITTPEQIALSIIGVGGMISSGLSVFFALKTRKELANHRQVRDEYYASLADPEKIEADFEKGARLHEMHNANRKLLPREGAGPPAKVYRPKLRGQKPGGWRPNRVN